MTNDQVIELIINEFPTRTLQYPNHEYIESLFAPDPDPAPAPLNDSAILLIVGSASKDAISGIPPPPPIICCIIGDYNKI